MEQDGKFTVEAKSGYIIIRLLVESLDLFETPDILTSIEAALREREYPDTLVDLSKTVVMDSSGLGFLITLKNILRKNDGRMAITGISERVSEVFRITKMNEFFTIAAGANDAEKIFGGPGKKE